MAVSPLSQSAASLLSVSLAADCFPTSVGCTIWAYVPLILQVWKRAVLSRLSLLNCFIHLALVEELKPLVGTELGVTTVQTLVNVCCILLQTSVKSLLIWIMTLWIKLTSCCCISLRIGHRFDLNNSDSNSDSSFRFRFFIDNRFRFFEGWSWNGSHAYFTDNFINIPKYRNISWRNKHIARGCDISQNAQIFWLVERKDQQKTAL